MYQVWNVPEWGSAGRRRSGPARQRAQQRQVVAALQAAGVRRADRDRASARSPTCGRSAGCSSSRRPCSRAATSAQVERAVNEEVARFLRRGSHGGRAAAGEDAAIARGSSAASSASAASAASPTCWRRVRCSPAGPISTRTRLQRIAAATRGPDPGDRQPLALRRRLHPGGSSPSASTRSPRRAWTGPSSPRPARRRTTRFPELERATLSNGLKIVLAERPLDSSSAVRSAARRRLRGRPVRRARAPRASRWRCWTKAPGPAPSIADQRRARGAGRQSLDGLAARRLGRLARGAARTSSTPRSRCSPTWCCNPSFPAADFERLKTPAPRPDPAGEGGSGRHGAAGVPRPALWSGTRLCQSLDRLGHRGIGREDQPRRPGRSSTATWFKPNHATLIVVGRHHDGGDPAQAGARSSPAGSRATCPTKNIGTVAQQPRSTVYLLDRPDAIQIADPGRQRRAAQGQSRRARDRDDEHGARRLASRRGST